jgi:hypothetical protein
LTFVFFFIFGDYLAVFELVDGIREVILGHEGAMIELVLVERSLGAEVVIRLVLERGLWDRGDRYATHLAIHDLVHLLHLPIRVTRHHWVHECL